MHVSKFYHLQIVWFVNNQQNMDNILAENAVVIICEPYHCVEQMVLYNTARETNVFSCANSRDQDKTVLDCVGFCFSHRTV